jgi:hypothetical protein
MPTWIKNLIEWVFTGSNSIIAGIVLGLICAAIYFLVTASLNAIKKIPGIKWILDNRKWRKQGGIKYIATVEKGPTGWTHPEVLTVDTFGDDLAPSTVTIWIPNYNSEHNPQAAIKLFITTKVEARGWQLIEYEIAEET